jgi:hypothetical protein
MQREFILSQMKEASAKIKEHIRQLEAESHFTHAEAEEFLRQVEKLYRHLSVYEHSLKNNEIAGDLHVHLKIMQSVSPTETGDTVEKTEEPAKEEVKPTVAEEIKASEGPLPRAIELSINNKFRIANELFTQNQSEFQAALQQLNSISSQEEAARYLDSLKQVYNWKDENPLVKSFYALVYKRFA